MHAIIKILPFNYIIKVNSPKFSVTNNLRYVVCLDVDNQYSITMMEMVMTLVKRKPVNASTIPPYC